MADDALKYSAILQYLRRYYYLGDDTWNVVALKTLATEAFAAATDEVSITNTSSELGSAGGIFKFDKAILLAAIETLLAEVDPDNTPLAPPSGYIPDFSQRPVTT
jgi:hypothetical protein